MRTGIEFIMTFFYHTYSRDTSNVPVGVRLLAPNCTNMMRKQIVR